MSNPRLKQLAQDGATNGQVVTWNGTVWTPVTPTVGLDTENQEEITTEVVTGTDTALADTLTNTATSAASVKAYLNGVLQVQGAGEDYTIVIGTGVITWLASTGTAVDMDTADVLIVTYDS